MKKIYTLPVILACLFVMITLFSCSKEERKSYEVHDFHGSWEFKEDGTEEWMRAKIPGSVHQNLLEQSLINDPFYRDEIISQKWVAQKDWVYKSNFDVEPAWLKRAHIELAFEGLDTYAVVMLNGEALVLSDNAFVSWTKEITSVLKERGNELEIHFHSPEKQNKDLAYFDNADKKEQGIKMYNRKPAFQYGSSYGPEWLGQGITAPVRFHLWDEMRIKDFYLKQELPDAHKANVEAIISIESDGNYNAIIKLSDKNGNVSISEELKLTKGLKEYRFDLEIKGFDYWSSHDIGDPKMQEITCELVYENTIDSISKKIGFRESRLHEDEQGAHFTLNDVPVAGKGVTVLPLAFTESNVKDEAYHKLIDDVLKANINMIRVNGAGRYLKDIFYDLCDEHGILVWQDIMLADFDYPIDSERFRTMISAELKYQVTRLRSPPSIVIWSGNAPAELKDNPFYTDFLRDELSKYTNEQYVASTAGLELSSTASYPPMTMIETFTEFDDRYVGSYMMSTHLSQPSDDSLIYARIHEEFNAPYDFQQYIYLSQLAQAKALKKQIESTRAKDRTQLMFTEQLNDFWPGISRSSIDYFGNWKAAQYQLQASYNEYLIHISEVENALNINFINDEARAFEAMLKIQLKDFEGNVLKTAEKEVFVKELSNTTFTALNKNQWLKGENKAGVVLQIDLIETNGDLLSNKLHYFVKTKDLELTYPQMPYKVTKDDGFFVLELFTNTLVKDLRLRADYDGFFEKNYFDLLPNDTLQIRFYNQYELDAFDPNAMQFNSIEDSYIEE